MNTRMKNRELNPLTPIVNILNRIVTLNQQRARFLTNIHNNSISSFTDDLNYCFKVLILDDSSYNFITSLLKQSVLTKNNICLTLKINEEKSKMPDVMAIYLVSPLVENFKQIVNDMKNNIYQNYSINFIEKPDDTLFEEFLTNIIKLDKYKQVFNIHVYPCKYSVIHPKVIDFCSLDDTIKKPYKLYNLGFGSIETENYYDLISNMIFNCLFSMKVSPLIKFRKGSSCEILINKIQNKFISTFNKFPKLRKEFQNSNLLLVILERDLLDIPIMLHHPVSFGALIQDICGMTFTEDKNKIKFQIDPINDYIWDESLTKPFYKVGEETFVEFKKYEQQMKIFGGNTTTNNLQDLSSESEKLAESIKNIEHKKIEGDILTKHANYYITITKTANQRNLGEMNEIELLLLGRREITKEINEKFMALKNEGKINPNNSLDVLRLCLIYFIIDKDNSNDKFIKEIIKNLSIPPPFDGNALIEYFDMIKKSGQEHSSKDLYDKLNNDNEQNKTMLNKVKGMTGNLFKKGFNLIKSAYNNLTTAITYSIATNILEECVYNKKDNEQNFSEYQINSDIIIPIKSSVYQNVFLFTLGGGSLNEFEFCNDYFNGYNLNFIYGADKIYSPLEFLEELNELALSNKSMDEKK